MPRGRDDDPHPPRHDHEAWVTCELCLRKVPPQLITQHHLMPKQKGGKAEHKTPLCKPCHKQVHAIFTNRELAKDTPRSRGYGRRRCSNRT